MAKSKNFLQCSIHVHLKKPFLNKLKIKELNNSIKKILDKEAKKINLKVLSKNQNKGFSGSSKEIFLYGVLPDSVHVSISVSNESKSIREFDKMLNKAMSLFDISETGVAGTFVTISKTFEINRMPISKFFDKQTVAEFSTQLKKRFLPVGLVLSTGIQKEPNNEETELSIMISNDEDLNEIDITYQTRVDEKPLWDILNRGNKSINDSKKNIFSTLGVKEK